MQHTDYIVSVVYPSLQDFIALFLFAAFTAFAARRLMTYLHALQQDDYDNARLGRWIIAHRVFDKRLSTMLIILWAASFALSPLGILMACIAAFIMAALYEKDPRGRAKKKLVMTARAKRIFFVSLGLCIGSGAAAAHIGGPGAMLVAVQIIPLLLMAGNIILRPVEDHIQKKFWRGAHEKLKRLNPKVIGITGSFGKTSVKHILGHVLKMHAPTLITPGSVNTPMGITRIIRERLEERHRFLIVEMGAYGPGSIARICALTPPDMAILISIGNAHYERFKSLDTVARTKSELGEAALVRGGMVIAHEQFLGFEYPQNLMAQNPGSFIACGPAAQNDLIVRDVQVSAAGLVVPITWRGADYTIEMPLMGLHHGHNAALAFAAAAQIGMAPENILIALKTVPQIEHRLEIKPQAGGGVIIDDAFNSNPGGFRAALEVLGLMPGRKILITPGMVELGAQHDEHHRALGEYAGGICDVAIIVKPARIAAFIDGFKATGGAKTLIEAESFKDAWAWIDANRRADDAILLENDLPDIYEDVPRL